MENKRLPESKPDNPEGHHFLTPQVTEITPTRHRVTPDTFIERNIVLGGLGQVIEVNFRPEEPNDICA